MKKLILASLIATTCSLPVFAGYDMGEFNDTRILSDGEHQSDIYQHMGAGGWNQLTINGEDSINGAQIKVTHFNPSPDGNGVVENRDTSYEINLATDKELKVVTDDTKLAHQKIDDLTTSQSALDTKVSSHDAAIKTLTAREDQVRSDADIKAISDVRDNELATRIDATDSKADQALTTAQQQQADITSNTNRIVKNEQDIIFLKSEVERLDAGMASVAAMSNLVRPYGVGKVNVSAAIGGYNGQEAIAVGAGYRMNEQVTFQGALSSGAGDFEPTWGVGVGFEF